jgi:hypothetical protein
VGYDFLKINGWDLPILECGKSINELGSRGQAFDGLPLATRQGVKRKWKCKTGLLSYDEAKALEHLLTNGGDSWQFNKDLFSAKGMDAQFARNSPAYLPNGGVVGTGQPRFVDNGVLIEEGTTNLLQNPSFVNLDGWGTTTTVAVSSAVKIIDTPYGKGLHVLWQKIGEDNVNHWMVVRNSVRWKAMGTKTLSCYIKVLQAVKKTGIMTLDARNADHVNDFSSSFRKSYGLSNAADWTRCEIIRNAWGTYEGTNDACFELFSGPSLYNIGDTLEFIIAAPQVEEKPCPTSFTIGTRMNERLSLPTQILNPKEFTIDITVKPKNIDFANRSMPFVSNWNNWREGSQRGFALRCFNNNWYPDFNVCNGVGYYTIKSNTPIPWDKESKIRAVLKAGEIFAIYVNGAKTTGIPPAQCVLDDSSAIELGYTGVNLGYFNGIMRDFAIYNVALPDTATVSNTTGTVFLSVSGDAIGTNTQCVAEINNVDYVRGTRRQQIDFTLTEA